MTYSKYIFHVKIQLFVTLKSDQDPDPHWFGALIRIRIVLAPRIRIRIAIKSLIRIRIETNGNNETTLQTMYQSFIRSDISTGRFSRRGRNWMRAWA
jgi:hypothetical protein